MVEQKGSETFQDRASTSTQNSPWTQRLYPSILSILMRLLCTEMNAVWFNETFYRYKLLSLIVMGSMQVREQYWILSLFVYGKEQLPELQDWNVPPHQGDGRCCFIFEGFFLPNIIAEQSMFHLCLKKKLRATVLL